ncbi:NUDIX hydrolase [Catenulispora subtropica]|uniref:NUDIX hydrolase n=1 Tax=Catenulispora subtropica TaxID=450798 RepID=UPI0031DDB931
MDPFTWTLIAQQKKWLGRRQPASGQSRDPAALAAAAADALLALADATDDPRAALTAHLAARYERSLDAGAPPLPGSTFNPDRAAWIASLPRCLAATVVVITDERDRVLLVQQPYLTIARNWGLPGGGADDDEPPHITAQRECLEELSIAVPIGRLLAIDWRPATDRPPLLIFAYDGGRLTPERIEGIRLLDGELSQYGFFTLEEAATLIPPRGHVFLTAAFEARASGNVADLRIL